jgi:predicted Zn finger-like uncharacterized protein
MTLLKVLACPHCHTGFDCDTKTLGADGQVIAGTLRCARCAQSYRVERGIPRFVSPRNYASSFGYQWNRFRHEQIDSINGTKKSERRFWAETGWDIDGVRGEWILDAGCGAGRFLDVASRAGCEVVGVDISDAVDAANANLRDRPNVHLVQASLYELPFRDNAFDGCYCIGVIQHTPDPQRSVRALPLVLKPDGRLAVTIYERRRFTLLNGKYLLRPFTRRLNHRWLLSAIRLLMPIAFPLTELLFRLPLMGRLFRFAVPVANYVMDSELSWRQRYQWAILDTFDMLSPEFDQPQREAHIRAVLADADIVAIQRLGNPGLNLVGIKQNGYNMHCKSRTELSTGGSSGAVQSMVAE